MQPAGLADSRAGQSHGRVSFSAQRVVLGIKNKKFRRAAARAIFPARIASQFHRFIFLVHCINRETASGPAPVQFPDDVHVAFGDHALDGAVGGALDRQGDAGQVQLGVVHPHVARVSDEVGRIIETKMIRENGGDRVGAWRGARLGGRKSTNSSEGRSRKPVGEVLFDERPNIVGDHEVEVGQVTEESLALDEQAAGGPQFNAVR